MLTQRIVWNDRGHLEVRPPHFFGNGRQQEPKFSRAADVRQSSLEFERLEADVAQTSPHSACEPVSLLARGALTVGIS